MKFAKILHELTFRLGTTAVDHLVENMERTFISSLPNSTRFLQQVWFVNISQRKYNNNMSINYLLDFFAENNTYLRYLLYFVTTSNIYSRYNVTA